MEEEFDAFGQQQAVWLLQAQAWLDKACPPVEFLDWSLQEHEAIRAARRPGPTYAAQPVPASLHPFRYC